MKRPRTAVEIEAAIETLARDAVNSMIERGLATYEIKPLAADYCAKFADFMLRDIRTFAETGKYPEYVSRP